MLSIKKKCLVLQLKVKTHDISNSLQTNKKGLMVSWVQEVPIMWVIVYTLVDYWTHAFTTYADKPINIITTHN